MNAVRALVTALKDDPALAAFTITDRPARPRSLPHIRVGPVREEPWSTNASNGARATISLTLTNRSGSFAALSEATDAIGVMLKTPLTIAGATSVVQRLVSSRFGHEPNHNLERADLSIELLIDLGDAT